MDTRREQYFITIFLRLFFFYICILSRTFIENDVKQKLEYNCKLDKIGDLNKFEGFLNCWMEDSIHNDCKEKSFSFVSIIEYVVFRKHYIRRY